MLRERRRHPVATLTRRSFNCPFPEFEDLCPRVAVEGLRHIRDRVSVLRASDVAQRLLEVAPGGSAVRAEASHDRFDVANESGLEVDFEVVAEIGPVFVGGGLYRLAVSSEPAVAEGDEEAFEALSDVVHPGVADVKLLRRSPRGEAACCKALPHEAVILPSSECRVTEAAFSVSELHEENETS